MVHKILISDSIILTIVIIMLIIMLFVTYKVIKITSYSDKILVLMLIFLDITLICKYYFIFKILLGHIIFNIIRIKLYSNPDYEISSCSSGLVSLMPVFFFSIAVLFNINKWYLLILQANRVYFLLRIQETIN